MQTQMVDASIAIKCVVQEEGTQAVVDLRSRFRFAAPGFLKPVAASDLSKCLLPGDSPISACGARLTGRAQRLGWGW
jgi:predicted nucleic acid-binding protein